MTFASLPMYDWPEVHGSIDQLWHSIAEEARQLGLAVPEELTRTTDPVRQWLSPELLVGQTCGLPLVQRLDASVVVLGSFAFDLPDTDPGDYHSVVIVAADAPPASLSDLAGARVAFNARDSQSGHAALQHAVAPMAADGKFFGPSIESGSHRASITAVGEGRADVAAVDAVSWLLALDQEPAAQLVRVLARTERTPGLPMITSLAHSADRPALVEAISLGVEHLHPDSRRTLHLAGFRPRTRADYDIIAQRLDRATELGYPTLA